MNVMKRICLGLCIILISLECCSALGNELQANFYNPSCPNLEQTIKLAVEQAMKEDPRIAASLVRLFFHDCFIQGCDASILLDDAPNVISEKSALPNANSVRGYDLIDHIKAKVEQDCPSTVSCSDIIALAARDATFLSGGPSWPVLLGRRDSLTANNFLANFALPAPFLNLSDMISIFSTQGLDATDLVALSGAHTFGRAKCGLFSRRLYNFTSDGMPDPTMNTAYLDKLRRICPENGDAGTLVDLETSTPNSFDNHYFQELTKSRGLLQSDQELFSFPNASTKAIVQSFSENQTLFFHQFGLSMVKLGNINPLTGSSGEIRRNCRMVN